MFKKNKKNIGRRRLSQAETPQTLDKKFLYRSQRSEAEDNVGRQAQRSVKVGPSRFTQLLQKLGLFILLLAVLVSSVNIISLSSDPKIMTIEASNTSVFLRDNSIYEDYVKQLLSSSVWNTNKITVNSIDVSRKLVSQFPELSSASLTVPLLAHRPIVYIQPAKPVLVINARNGSFIIADTGKALIQSENSSELSKYKLPELDDQTGLKLAVGHQALRAGDVAFIQTVIAEFSAKHIDIASFSLPPESSELDVRVARQPYKVKFNLQNNSARQQVGTYIAMINYLKQQNITPSKYVDVRVDGRAYYQ